MAVSTQGPVSVADPQLSALEARESQLREAIERRAAEVVRSWLIDHDRTWVAVDFTKSRAEPPFGEDAELAAVVGRLPQRAFGSGLDVRGSFIVRLADLNGYLGRLHDDSAPAAPGPRIESVVVRDPDGGTYTTLFLDGAEVSEDDVEEYVIDAGRGCLYEDWIDARDGAMEVASPAAAALLRESYDYPPGHQYIEQAPEGWPHDEGGEY